MNLLKLSYRVTRLLSTKHIHAASDTSPLGRGFAIEPQAENEDQDLLPKPVITRVDRINETTLCVNFSDSTRCSFNTVWLRDSCRCPLCVHPLTHGRKVDCTQYSPELNPISWSLKDSSVLEISWPRETTNVRANDGQHTSSFSSEWLYQFRPLFERSETTPPEITEIKDETYVPRASIILWNRETFEEDPPEVSFGDFMSLRSGLKQVLKNVTKFGFCLLKDVPVQENEVSKIAVRMGYVREIGCGRTFSIGSPRKQHQREQPSAAPTTNNLNSQAYREWSPGVQLLHCIRNDNQTMKESAAIHEFIDGFAAAQWLRYHDPSSFDILTRTAITFSFLDIERDRWHRETNPIISLDSRGQIREVHYSTLSMRPPLLPTTQMNLFYNAYRLLSKRLRDTTLAFTIQMQPGDLVIFNNRRIIERGTGDLESSCDVFMQGCYMDASEILACYEKMKKDDAIDDRDH